MGQWRDDIRRLNSESDRRVLQRALELEGNGRWQLVAGGASSSNDNKVNDNDNDNFPPVMLLQPRRAHTHNSYDGGLRY